MKQLSFFIVIIITVFRAYGESLLEKIGWHGPELSVIITCIVIFFVLTFSLIIYYLYQHFLETKESHDHSEQLFNEAANRMGLSAVQVDKVKHLLRHENLIEPQVIFQSISLYEKCLDKEVNRLLRKNISDELKKEENDILSSIRKKIGFHHLPLEHPLASSRNITIGQTGSIFGKNYKKPLIQKAVVVDSNEFTFSLQYDVDKEDISYLSPGDEIKFVFSRQSDSVYGIRLHVISTDGSGIIDVNHTINLRRNQLRQYVRIEVNLPLKFRLLNTVNSEKSDIKRGEIVESKMSDISGGGLSFLCERTLRAGDLISINFSLPESRFIGIYGKILRIGLQEGKAKSFYKHHVQFQNLETRKRNAIIKYIFNKQRQINQWR